MTKFERLLRLYKVSFYSEINGDKYFFFARFINELKFEANHKITPHLEKSAALNKKTIEKYLNDYYHELSFREAKKYEAHKFVKTLPRCHFKLLLRHLNR